MKTDAHVAEWRHVSKTYPRADEPALDDFSLTVDHGEIVVLVGPNGSGKTTAMELGSGLRTPSRGSIVVGGTPVRPGGPQNLILGVQLQDSTLPRRIRVSEALRAVACLYADPGPTDDVVAALGLTPHINSMVTSLSGGWQRRLSVALACIGRPRMLILDEPTSGIDPVSRAELWEFLRGRRGEGVGMLVSTHDLSEAEAYADRLLVLHRGRPAFSGTVAEALAQAGGPWRLRVLGAAASVDEWAHTQGIHLLSSGSARVVVGTRTDVVDAADSLESARESGRVTYDDALRGPVRLEDVFLAVVSEKEPPSHIGGDDDE